MSKTMSKTMSKAMSKQWLAILLCSALPWLGACQAGGETSSTVPSADGVPIRFETTGMGEPALVFIHGWNCDRGYWRAQLDHFSNTHRVVAIDLAGHGQSGDGRSEWSMGAFGEDVAAVVRALELDHVVLVGHSLGGPVSIEAARILGDSVKLVVGADTLNDVSQGFPEDQLAGMLAALEADFPGTVAGLVRSSFFVPESDPALVDWITNDMAAAPPAAGIGAFAAYGYWFNEQAGSALAAVRAPIRLINSDYRPTNLAAGQAVSGSFEVSEMSGVGHFVMMEDPDTFNQLLTDLVEDL